MRNGSALLNIYVHLVLGFIIVPLLVVLPMAFSNTSYLVFPPKGISLRWFEAFFSDDRWMDAAGFSLSIASVVAVVNAVVGTMTAFAMIRGRVGASWAALFQAALMLPIIVPHIALAVALYLFFQRIGLMGTTIGYVLAHSVITLPFSVFTISAALSKIDPALESAAMSCGATRFAAFRFVTLPMLAPGIASGALFAFIVSFDEPVIAYFLAGARDKTLPRLMFEDLQMNITPMLAAIAVVLTGLTTAALLATVGIRRLSRSSRLMAEP